MKFFLTIIFLSTIAFAGTCYTAVNGFIAMAELPAKLAERASQTTDKIKDLGETAKRRQEKLEEIKKLQTEIKEVQTLSYIKSQNILHNIKVKNKLLDIKGSSILIDSYFNK